MLPWLALGHLLPFMELAKRLASRGHRVSFISTPKNIKRLPPIPPSIAHLITLVQFPLPWVGNLPPDAEATIDLPSDDLRPYLKQSYDALQHDVLSFLREASVDWIVYDYASYWVPRISSESGVPCAYLSLFKAAVLAFQGSPQAMLGNEHPRTTVEDYIVAPKWVPFPSTIAFRPYEVRQVMAPAREPDASGVTEMHRFAATVDGCDFLAIRSCVEFEPAWLQLVGELFRKPIVPIGMLPPINSDDTDNDVEWDGAFRWLDEQEAGSVVYVAFGSEAKLTAAQVEEIAHGLELSRLPFLWASRAERSPEGFEERTTGRGFVCKGWVPQTRLLAHPSVGGFLTHGGWNSIVEGLSFGVAMAVMPLMFEQGLNARNLVERKLAVEVPRNEEDGSFTAEGIAGSLRLVMAEEKGEALRANSRDCRNTFGNLEMQDRCLDGFVKYLCDHKGKKVSPKTE